jgi:Tol biopolymer transport system component
MDNRRPGAAGEHIVSRLEIVDVYDGRRIVAAEFNGRIEAPNWTRDGRRLIYNSGGRLVSFDLETRETAIIDTGFADRCNNDHVLSSDNTKLAFSHHTAEDGRSRIYIIPITGGRPALITPLGPSYLHGWSPDGGELAYCAERNGQFDIYTIPAEGGVEKRLTDTTGLDDGPEYSPDGAYIWFNSSRTGLMQVWRMKRDGSDPVQMTFDAANNWFPHVSPDGKLVAFLTYRKDDVAPDAHPPNKHVSIRIMSSGGGEIRTIAELFGGQGTMNVNSWAPDSRRLAFVSYELKED